MSSFHTAQAASCVETLSKDPTFTSCMMGYATFVQEQDDPSHMAQAICSDQCRAKLACMLGYMKQCPELMTGGDTNGGGGMEAVSQFMSPEGIDTMCALMSGGGGGVGGKCAEVIACANKTGSQYERTDAPAGPSPFSNLQDNIGMICGAYTKNLYMCFETAPAECEDFVNNIKNMIPMYDETKAYVLNQCPKLPKVWECNKHANEDCLIVRSFLFISEDIGIVSPISVTVQIPYNRIDEVVPWFGVDWRRPSQHIVIRRNPANTLGFISNKCVKENVESEAFLECYRPVEQAYTQDHNARRNCSVFLMGKKCVDDNVGVKCGQASADAMAAAAPFLIEGIPKTCVMTPTSAAGGGLEVFVTKALMITI